MAMNSGKASGLLTVTKKRRRASDSAANERAGSEARGARGAAWLMLAEAYTAQGHITQNSVACHRMS
jgi:hypothetical protein